MCVCVCVCVWFVVTFIAVACPAPNISQTSKKPEILVIEPEQLYDNWVMKVSVVLIAAFF